MALKDSRAAVMAACEPPDSDAVRTPLLFGVWHVGVPICEV